jgi:hypothetical protein
VKQFEVPVKRRVTDHLFSDLPARDFSAEIISAGLPLVPLYLKVKFVNRHPVAASSAGASELLKRSARDFYVIIVMVYIGALECARVCQILSMVIFLFRSASARTALDTP